MIRYIYAIRTLIKDFADKQTEKIWINELSRKLPIDIQLVARRKLRMLNNAKTLLDLNIPPNNLLESLKGARKGQYSIRINKQWRICFVWSENNAYMVKIVDYH